MFHLKFNAMRFIFCILLLLAFAKYPVWAQETIEEPQEPQTIAFTERIAGQYAFTLTDIQININRFGLPSSKAGKVGQEGDFNQDEGFRKGLNLQRSQIPVDVNAIVLNEQKLRLNSLEQIIINETDVLAYGGLNSVIQIIKALGIRRIYTLKLKGLTTSTLPSALFEMDKKNSLANLIIEGCENLDLEEVIDLVATERKSLKAITFVQQKDFVYPRNLEKLNRLEEVRFRGMPNIGAFPDTLKQIVTELRKIDDLSILSFEECGITAVPSEIKDLDKLKNLILFKNRIGLNNPSYQLPVLPRGLVGLDLSYNRFGKMQKEIVKLEQLRYLNLTCNQINFSELQQYITIKNATGKKKMEYFEFDCNLLSEAEMIQLANEFANLAKYRTGLRNYENDFRPFFKDCTNCSNYLP
jgi:Leucine-rich repeat (LRR) protein